MQANKHERWYAGILRGRAWTRNMLAVQLMHEDIMNIPDEALRHLRMEKEYLEHAKELQT